MYGFEISGDDVATVLQLNWMHVGNTGGASFDAMGEMLLDKLDHWKVEREAMRASTDLDEQTDAAYQEIARQLIRLGVLQDACDGA